jgi:hypothetical protein
MLGERSTPKLDPKKKAILARIETIESDISRGHEYLESGAHADWHGFRAIFVSKRRNEKDLPPHKDWVKNVFLPGRERALSNAERLLERLSLEEQKNHS